MLKLLLGHHQFLQSSFTGHRTQNHIKTHSSI